MTVPSIPLPAVTSPRARSATIQAVAVVATVVALIALVGWLVYTHTDDYQAKRACESWVRDQLTSPSTAKFSDEDWFEAGESLTGRPAVDGAVDSQNEYGAMIRSRFSCAMSHDGGEWTATDGDVV